MQLSAVRPSVRLSHLSIAAAACGGFAAVDSAGSGRRCRSIAARHVCSTRAARKAGAPRARFSIHICSDAAGSRMLCTCTWCFIIARSKLVPQIHVSHFQSPNFTSISAMQKKRKFAFWVIPAVTYRKPCLPVIIRLLMKTKPSPTEKKHTTSSRQTG